MEADVGEFRTGRDEMLVGLLERAGPGVEPAEQHGGVGDAVSIAGRPQHAEGVDELVPTLFVAALVGEDLSDVDGPDGRIDVVAGGQPGVAPLGIEEGGLVPRPAEVLESTEVVEHDGLPGRGRRASS